MRKRLKKESVISYNLRYLTGAYPEGNALHDLYIHPIDLVVYLFGEAKVIAYEQPAPGTFFLMLRHAATIGALELSTSYSWSNAKETLSICTYAGIYKLSQMEELTYTSKQRSICGIPIEKVIKRNPTTEYLFHRNNFSPIIANNQIYTQGFYDEIKSFADCVENQRISVNSFETLKETYRIIDKISKG